MFLQFPPIHLTEKYHITSTILSPVFKVPFLPAGLSSRICLINMPLMTSPLLRRLPIPRPPTMLIPRDLLGSLQSSTLQRKIDCIYITGSVFWNIAVHISSGLIGLSQIFKSFGSHVKICIFPSLKLKMKSRPWQRFILVSFGYISMRAANIEIKLVGEKNLSNFSLDHCHSNYHNALQTHILENFQQVGQIWTIVLTSVLLFTDLPLAVCCGFATSASY